MARSGSILLVMALASLAACSAGSGPRHAAGPAPGAPWLTTFQRDNPLVGQVWERASGRLVAPTRVARAVAAAEFVLLGEKHDNPDHHRIQAWLVARMIAAGRHPAVAFEMLTSEQEEALEGHLSARPDDAAGIGEAVGWERTGWPPWSQYQPIAAAALEDRSPILPASLPRASLKGLVGKGIAALDESLARQLEGAVPLPDALRASLAEEIVRGHCHQLPASLIDPMVMVQTVKDAVMARTMMRGAALPERDSAVLIAGNGHVRKDRGVPWHLRRWNRAPRIVTVAAIEVDDGMGDVADYSDQIGGDEANFDFVWFTPRLDEDDPCAKYADQLKRTGRQQPAQTAD